LFTPLRYQVTYADCYPTSILNALVWLFARDELLRWLRRGGVAVLDIRITAVTTHSILVLAASGDHLDCWDPYIRGARYEYGRGALRLESDGHTPNLRLTRSWLDSTRIRRYSFGPLAGRVGVLIRRTRRGCRRLPVRSPDQE
jgi:hypothetical protein